MVAHDYWIRFVELYLDLYGLGPDDRLLCCLQFFYGDPPWLFLASLRAGATLVAMRRFSVSRFWPVVLENRVTRLFALASIPALLLKAEPRPEGAATRLSSASTSASPSCTRSSTSAGASPGSRATA